MSCKTSRSMSPWTVTVPSLGEIANKPPALEPVNIQSSSQSDQPKAFTSYCAFTSFCGQQCKKLLYLTFNAVVDEVFDPCVPVYSAHCKHNVTLQQSRARSQSNAVREQPTTTHYLLSPGPDIGSGVSKSHITHS